jgi:NDP-sugar pyrophosphorylase family protein
LAVVSGAILVVGAENDELEFTNGSSAMELANPGAIIGVSISCSEILGRSLLERTIERLIENGVERITILVEQRAAAHLPSFRKSFDCVQVQAADDSLLALTSLLESYCEAGVDYTFILNANVYTECDYLDLKEFHRERRQPITRAFDRDGILDLWIVDCAKAQQFGISRLLSEDSDGFASYCIRDYVNRLSQPADLRRLVVDAFHRRCGIRPEGKEVRPGVWVEEDSEVHRRARIVAPAYIGRASKVREDTLITRSSSIECRCDIDYGTVIEDSSVLSNSYVGIWLDVSHAVVSGSKLVNLARNVALEISDPSIIRGNIAASKSPKRESAIGAKLMAWASSQ